MPDGMEAGIDFNSPLEDLRRCADQGLAEPQYLLGLRYVDSEDHSEAARWLRLAAEQGHAKAQLAFALRYHVGEGVPEALTSAFAAETKSEAAW